MKEILRKSAFFPRPTIISTTTENTNHYLKLASIFDATTDLVATFDVNGKITHLNRSGQKLLGINPINESSSFPLINIYPEQQRNLILLEAIPTAMREGVWSGETTLISYHTQVEVPISQVIIAHKDKEEKIEFFSTIVRDIADIKQAEKTLEMFAKVFHCTQEAILISDSNNIIQKINPAFTTITGYTEAEVVGKNPRFLQSGRHDPGFYQEFWQSINSKGEWQGEIWNRRKNGEIYPEWLTISTIKDEKGRITNFVAIFSDITTVKLAERHLIYMAHHDALTGLPNRILLKDRLKQALLKGIRNESLVAVVFIDLDRFKPINDLHGHKIGDLLLQAVAERLKGCVREEDTVARIGGDEFIVILEDIFSLEDAAKIAKKAVHTLSTPFAIEGKKLLIGASIGISIFPLHGRDPEILIKNADKAMYKIKEAGKNGFGFYK
ncbi:MAG: diguanylate cyclase [Blastocatellia bacterium]